MTLFALVTVAPSNIFNSYFLHFHRLVDQLCGMNAFRTWRIFSFEKNNNSKKVGNTDLKVSSIAKDIHVIEVVS